MLITLLLRVALVVPPMPGVHPAVVPAAVVEAAGVWAPYGVAVEAAVPSGCAAGDRIILTVAPSVVPSGAQVSTRMPTSSAPLGAIAFAPDGAPATAITVFLTDIERLVAGARLMGLSQWQWPASLREHLLGRVLGRVLAHEIGHYVLRTRQHAADGLMGPVQLADDLISPSRHHFRLTAADAALLEGRR
jgi:hypothetical protein